MTSETPPIDASPTKELFIDILTRDIGIKDCILDLLDNSIHNAIVSNKIDITKIFEGKQSKKNLSRISIDIKLDKKKFEIDDNCGGISIDDAANEVFRFGKEKYKQEGKGLGVYGIGMKRAFFKLGKEASLFSKTKNEELGVIIKVNEWLKKKDWTLEFDYADKLDKLAPIDERGTTINVDQLNDLVKKKFSSPMFQYELIEEISKTYALFIEYLGIKITVNKQKVKPSIPTFAKITTTKKRSKLHDVDILIIAGVTPKSDSTPHGWYVYCNGRMIMSADQSEKTGWSEGNAWHPKYNHFLGLVFFSSNKVEKLPWNTAKEGVEFEHPVYQNALGLMRTYGKTVKKYLADSYKSDEIESIPQREVLEKARDISFKEVAKSRDSQFAPKIPKSSETSDVPINFKRPRVQIERIKKSIGCIPSKHMRQN
jgi:hypothetical protein